MRRAGGLAAVALLVAGAFLLGVLLTRSAESARDTAAPERETRDGPTRLLDEVRSELAGSYYRSLEPAVLRADTVAAMIAALEDPHTEYLTPAEFQALKERTDGSYSGIGLTVGPSDDGLVVISAFQGPARTAGIRKGDVIVRIDGRPAGRLPFERSLALIKGEKGTTVRLIVKRPKAGTIRFTVRRQEIDLPAVRTRLFAAAKPKLGHVRVLSFRSGAAALLESATSDVVGKGAAGLVLDLRDNPGGLLSEAVDAVSLFLDEGVVVTTDGAREELRTYAVDGDAEHPKLPLVILVDEGTASAAEILAAALGEHRRATIVGRRTFGKASVQSLQVLSNGGALKVTTAKYLTEYGTDLTEVGVKPRIRARDDPLTRRDEALADERRVLLGILAG